MSQCLRLALFWAKVHGLLYIPALPVSIACFGIKLTKAAFGWAQSQMKTKKHAILSDNTGKAGMIIILPHNLPYPHLEAQGWSEHMLYTAEHKKKRTQRQEF